MGLKFKDKITAGVPVAGEVAERELQLDLKNGTLYSSTDGTDLIALGGGGNSGKLVAAFSFANNAAADVSVFIDLKNSASCVAITRSSAGESYYEVTFTDPILDNYILVTDLSLPDPSSVPSGIYIDDAFVGDKTLKCGFTTLKMVQESTIALIAI